ncbi:hypothetical protein BY996DRAFT_7784455 [Phakopsora pachyrhizi]|nr:hypothetical protein BY996DRAFT_7784455 [Phakopsora pachyrhizi]
MARGLQGTITVVVRIIHLIRRNLNSKQPDQIDEVISIMENITIGWSGTEPDPLIREKNLMIGCLMTGFAEIGRSEILDRLISFSRRRSGGMSRYLWMSILRGLVDLGKPDLIKRFVERMRSEDGFEPDLQVQCILISGTISSNFQKGLEQIDRLISTSSTLTGDDEKRVEDEQLSPTNTVVLANTVPTENFNVIISTLLRHRLIDRAKDLIEIISEPSNQSFISKPNSTTLNHFLKFYSIQDHSPPPSSSSSDPLQQQHQQQQQPSLAEVLEVLKKFEGLGVKPDVISFTILFNILIKLGFQTKEMIGKVLKLMSVMGVEANAITYGSIINQLCKTNQPRDVFVAYEILEEIERLGVATTTITYTALIQALLRNHTKEYTSQNPSLIPSPIPNGNSSNLNAASTASSGTTAMTTESLTLAISLIDRLKSRDFSINQVIYNALINTMMITGQIPRAIQILKILRDDHHRRRLRRLQRSLGYKEKLSKGDDDRGGCDYYYGNGLMDSYGIVLRRLIEFGQLDLAREVCKDFRVEFLGNQFRGHGDPNKNVGDDDDGSGGYVPDWIRKYIELIERSF